MPIMSGKTALLELLRQEGVRMIFGNPGTTELPLMDALAAEHELRYILALQEAPAMSMADGYAQASGQCAMVNLHAAPGLGNAMGMLYDAQKAGSPLLVTAGQHEQRFNFTEPLLWADLPVIARPSSNGRRKCAGWRICRAPSIAPSRPPWRRRWAPCSSRSRAIS